MLDSQRANALRRHPIVQRLGRFALSGVAVQTVYTALMAVLLLGADLSRQLALAISYAGALIVHFTLNRGFVFVRSGGYRHGLSSHGKRYVLAAILVYVATALGVAVVPEALGVTPFVAWVLVVVVLSAFNFVLLDRFVFR
jgi:putative flippase GtrA